MRVDTLTRIAPDTPLAAVTFCVLDIETTGGNGVDDVTEIAAVKVRCGEVLGSLQTLVECAGSIPLQIQRLTGISTDMVRGAPLIEQVLPHLLEFARGTVLVGHNVRFDLRFIGAELERFGYPTLTSLGCPVVDTLALARRLVRDDVDDCRLATLAAMLGLDHQPTHRAMTDVLATVDLLHALLERASGYGAHALDDLLALPRTAASKQAHKLALVRTFPRTPGVAVAHGHGSEVIHVDAAGNLRRRVHSWFASTDRRRIGPMLREAQRFSWIDTADHDAAAALAAELIGEHRPRYGPRAAPRYRRLR